MSAAYAVRGSPAAPNGRCAIRPSSRAREDRAPVLELVDVARRLVAEDLDRVLVAEVVRALDGVERVLLGIVLRRVPERSVDPAFGRAGVAADGMDLGDDGDVGAHVERLDGGAHPRAAAAHDQDVVLRVHGIGRYTTGRGLGPLHAAASMEDERHEEHGAANHDDEREDLRDPSADAALRAVIPDRPQHAYQSSRDEHLAGAAARCACERQDAENECGDPGDRPHTYRAIETRLIG